MKLSRCFLRGKSSSRLRRLLICAIMVFGQSEWIALADEGFDRPGTDYTKFVVKSGDPAICALRCESERRCHAWSFSYPTAEGAPAVCWLKNGIPPRVRNDCCVSGVRGSGVNAPRSRDIEFGIDRPGGDFKTFDTQPDSTGASCAVTCKGEQRCRAWTYVRPGYQGSSARCVLKERVTTPRRQPCCISGVVR